MFKAKLIEEDGYYGHRKIRIMLYFLPAIPGAFIINYSGFPIWMTILMVITYIGLVIYNLKNQKKIEAYSGQRQIEIDEGLVRIKSKDHQADIEIRLDQVDKIGIPSDYGMPEESLKDITSELSGKAKKNFIEVSSGQHKQRFDFIIDSYYMIHKFDGLIKAWAAKGYVVECV
jgi:hypothetical protein